MNPRALLRRHRHKILPALLLVAAGWSAWTYRQPLRAWFMVDGPGGAESRPAAGPESRPAEAVSLSPEVVTSLEAAFAAYESIRALLAADDLDGLGQRSRELAQAVKAAPAAELTLETRAKLDAAASAAGRLATADGPDSARLRFGEVSEALVGLTALDPRLREGLHVFRCPMAEGYQKWFQPSAEIENPYMGQRMLACGAPDAWEASSAAESQPAGPHTHTEGEIAYWTCSMHPSVQEAEQGTCPICNMDLTPVTREQLETGVILVDAVRRQRFGIRTETVRRRPLRRSIRAVGVVVEDQSRVHDVTLRVEGWIQGMRVNKPGQSVRRGRTLFNLYSPDLISAQEELLIARRSGEGLVRAARARLRTFGLTDRQLDEIAAEGRARETLPILSPAGGVVLEKRVNDGAHVRPGQLLYRIADLRRVWVEAEVYEQDLPHVSIDQPATVTLPYLPGRTFEGRVAFVYPYLSGSTRTGKVRVVLDNPEGELRPQMYANVELAVDLGERLAVPAEAVIYTGPRRLVFVDLGGGSLRPQEIEIGTRAGDWFEVRSGLSGGEDVVSSGNFVVAAESRLRSAAKYWEASDDSD